MTPIRIHSSLYKIGRHGLVYMEIDGLWIHSGKSREEVEKAINKRAEIDNLARKGRLRLI
jgi:hypothetical protein